MSPDPTPVALPWQSLLLVLVVGYRVGIAIILEGFHAMHSLQRRRLLEEGAVEDPRLAELLAHPHRFALGLTLLNQVMLLVGLALVWPLRRGLPGGAWSLGGLIVLYLWLLDLALPTLLVVRDPFAWVRRCFPLYRSIHRLLSPLVLPLARQVERRREQVEREADPEEPSGDAVTALLEEGEAEGILEEEDRELIRNVVNFGDTVVREVMTPRTAIQAVEVESGLEAAWAAFREGRHSRLPLYQGSVDRVVGILLLKDLLDLPPGDGTLLRNLCKEPFFVPESKPIQELLREMQRARTQLAIVVDEFGSVSGLVTIEDLLEEVFGEIREEHETDPGLGQVGPGEYLVPGSFHIEDLEARLGLHWEREGFDTVGGLVMARLGRVPRPQDRVRVEGAEFVVVEMRGSRILRVQVRLEGAEGSGA